MCIDYDDHVPEVEFNDAVDRIELSYDDAIASGKSNSPRVDSWKDVVIKHGNVRATIGEPTEICWGDAIREMTFIRTNVFQPNFETNRPSIGQLSDLLFGKETYKLSVTSAYCSLSYIMTESLLAKAIYTHLWTQIDTASLPSNSDAHLHVAGQTFWAALEEALNTDIRTKILPSFLADKGMENYCIIFDDDKMHFNLGRGEAPACLKMSRHIRDNRIGP
eukprot:scaffold80904_cov56-Attheya_sp.AAC.1